MSKFIGTYKQKKVVRLSPDAIVKINGDVGIACEFCKKAINLNDFITDLSIQAEVEAGIPSASLTFSVPRDKRPLFFSVLNYSCKIKRMHEVEIFIKGRFQYGTKDHSPGYYRVFWGFVSDVVDNYTSGVHTVTVDCAGYLRWWELQVAIINPAVINPQQKTGTTTLSEKNPYEIIQYLASRISPELNAASLTATGGGSKLDEGYISGEDGYDAYSDGSKTSAMKVWKQRMAEVANHIRLFGLNGSSKQLGTFKPRKDNVDTYLYDKMVFDRIQKDGVLTFDEGFIGSFRPIEFIEINLVENDTQTFMEVAQLVKGLINYEFYQDMDGTVTFKPPFYNIDTRLNPNQVIKDEDIVSWNFTKSEKEIKTRISVKGTLSNEAMLGAPPEITPSGFYEDYRLWSRFGLREENISEFRLFDTPQSCYNFAASELDRINATRGTYGSLDIIGRPEIRLGVPIYIPSVDTFAYVMSINHNFKFGESFTTSLTICAFRRRHILKSKETGLPTLAMGEQIGEFDYLKILKDSGVSDAEIETLKKLAFKTVNDQTGVKGNSEVYSKGDKSSYVVKMVLADKAGYEVVGCGDMDSPFSYGRDLVFDDDEKLYFRTQNIEAVSSKAVQMRLEGDTTTKHGMGDMKPVSDLKQAVMKSNNMIPGAKVCTCDPATEPQRALMQKSNPAVFLDDKKVGMKYPEVKAIENSVNQAGVTLPQFRF